MTSRTNLNEKNWIKKADLKELSTFVHPPQIVASIIISTFTLLTPQDKQIKKIIKNGKSLDLWPRAIKFLKQKEIIKKLTSYDLKSIKRANIVNTKAVLPPVSEEAVCKVGKQSLGLFKWVKAVIELYENQEAEEQK